MKMKLICASALLALASTGRLSAAPPSAYLAPGIWAICEATGSPVFCGVKQPIGTYQLFLAAGGPAVIGFSWTVMAELEDGTPVVRSGIMANASPAMSYVIFPGKVMRITIEVTELLASESARIEQP